MYVHDTIFDGHVHDYSDANADVRVDTDSDASVHGRVEV